MGDNKCIRYFGQEWAWENNIKAKVREMGCLTGMLMKMAQDRIQWLVLVKAVETSLF
jgi:hypothetical protein